MCILIAVCVNPVVCASPSVYRLHCYSLNSTASLSKLISFTNKLPAPVSVQFKMISMRSKKPMIMCSTLSQKFPQHCLNDYGPLLSYQGRSSSTSSFHTSLLQVINGVMSLALCSKIVSQVPQQLTLPRCKPLVMVALPASLSAWSFPFTPACPGRYIHRSFERWMSVIDTFQSGLPIPLFDFCSKFIESVRMTACVVWLSPLEAIQGV